MAKNKNLSKKDLEFKDFVKSVGLDQVNYESLNSREKRIYNGLKTYSQRIIYKGQFLNSESTKRLKSNKDIQNFAANNNKPLNQYINENIEDIVQVYEGAFSLTKNNNNVLEFIDKSNAKTFLTMEGETMTKAEFKMYIQRQIQEGFKEEAFNNIFNFDIKKNAEEIQMADIERISSPDK